MQISALCPSATRVSLAWIPSGNALVSPALGNFRSLLVALRGTAIPRRKGTPAAAALPRQGGGWGADINALTVFFFSFSASLFSFFSIRHEVLITFCLPFYIFRKLIITPRLVPERNTSQTRRISSSRGLSRPSKRRNRGNERAKRRPRDPPGSGDVRASTLAAQMTADLALSCTS